MKAFNGFEAKRSAAKEPLPAGGYVAKIMGAKEETYTWGSVLVISFGYHWDWNEAILKGKSVGVLFRNKEWEMNGNTGWTTECCALDSVKNIRNNAFKMPKDKPLKQKAAAGTVNPMEAVESFADDGDLPF